MPPGSRRQQSRGQGSESAIGVSADELPSQVVEEAVQADEMECGEQGVDEDDEEEEAEGKRSCCGAPHVSAFQLTTALQKSKSSHFRRPA